MTILLMLPFYQVIGKRILYNITDAVAGALHNTITPALIIILVTHHIRDHPDVEVPRLIPEIAVDPDHIPHTK